MSDYVQRASIVFPHTSDHTVPHTDQMQHERDTADDQTTNAAVGTFNSSFNVGFMKDRFSSRQSSGHGMNVEINLPQ